MPCSRKTNLTILLGQDVKKPHPDNPCFLVSAVFRESVVLNNQPSVFGI